jgi:glycosyltransferase involved in cell wall biosynthesis
VSIAADAWLMPYWTWVWAPMWRFLLGARNRPPVVAVVHNPADHDAGLIQRRAARGVLRRSDALFTHAETLAAGLERDYRGKPIASHPLPPVGDVAAPGRDVARRRLGWPGGRRIALFLGLIRPYKGVDLLLDAAAELGADSDWLVIVAGEPWGSLGADLERQRDRLGLAGRVRLELGWVPEERVSEHLAAADLVVLPYRRGSQSAVAPMALAHGVPVVTTAVGGVPEIIRDGVNGVVVPPEDPTALAGALRRLDGVRLDRLADGAIRSASGLGWSSYAVELERLVDSVV